MSRLPMEFLGEARVFRDAVCRADLRVNSAVPALAAPLRRRLTRKSTLRPDGMIDAARAWRDTVSDDFTLDVRTRAHRRDGLCIAELRLTGARWRSTQWIGADNAPGVSLVWLILAAEGGAFNFTVRPAANLLLHALGRRFQRGNGQTVPEIVRDLKPIGAVLETDAIEIAAPPGRWVGERLTVRDDVGGQNVPMLHVQTFLY